MALNYLRDVQPLEGEGVSDADIAAALSADPARFTSQRFTVGEVADRLSAGGQDGSAIVDSVMGAMDTVAESNRLVKNKVRLLDNDQNATVDLGNKLQRDMLRQFAALGLVPLADVEAVLALATEPTVEASEVTRCREQYEADSYAGAVQEAIAAARDVEGYTSATIKAAVEAVEAE